MKFLRLSILLGWLFASDRTLAADDTQFITVISGSEVHFDSTKPADDQTAQLNYLVPVAKWRATPRWKPETEPAPLDAAGAVEAAKRWIAAQPWADQLEGFSRLDLVRWGDPAKPDQMTGRWYYSVHPIWKKRKEDEPTPQPASTPAIRIDLRPAYLVVLFDGTVIGPTVSKLVTGGRQK